MLLHGRPRTGATDCRCTVPPGRTSGARTGAPTDRPKIKSNTITYEIKQGTHVPIVHAKINNTADGVHKITGLPPRPRTPATKKMFVRPKQNEFPDRELNPGLAGESRLS